MAPGATVSGERDDRVRRTPSDLARQEILNELRLRRVCRQASSALDQTSDRLQRATSSLRGSVITVSRDGKLLTIKLEHSASKPSPGDRGTIHANGRYKGEFVADTIDGTYVFGRLITARDGVAIRVGDLAHTPPDSAVAGPSANNEIAAAIDAGMAAILSARVDLWETQATQPVANAATPVVGAEPKQLSTVARGKHAPIIPVAPPALGSLPAHEAIARLSTCRSRLQVANDRAAVLTALDDAAKELMTLHRLLVTASDRSR